MSTPDINISLETHLQTALRPLRPLLPPHIAQQLAPYVGDAPPPVIPYNTLLSLSKWTRSEEGQKCLKSNGLDPHAYSMVSLLAGATTSPDRKFGAYVPPKDPEEIEADRIRERKTITVLLNALLSIGCVGFAAWWAADKTGWKQEWRALFALFAAFVVAIAEAGLYMIWASRQSTTSKSRPKTRSARHKKVDSASTADHDSKVDSEVITDSATENPATATLRQRKP
ncbi:hypothetical protein BDN70DRAFT_805200 [Pholiota conissans]|uniref:Uncharacterized protein n=1 Tax=Pholiota conissans TaxID=109636 RepID=A0A9P5Z4I5_9AGAR|nr:hypothetical protein BDN70DRAFT_805200 [Pholiota conissans]